MVIREDVDIGSVVIGNLHRISQFTQLRLGKVVDVLMGLRHNQLGLLYCCLGFKNIPMPRQRHTDGLNNVSTQDMSLVQLQKDLETMPVKLFSSLAPLSPNELLCMMHAKNPCTPTDLHKGLGEGPWFQRTPALTTSVAPPGSTNTIPTTHGLDLPPIPNVGSACNNSLFSNENGSAKDIRDMDDTLNYGSKGRRRGSIPMTPIGSTIAEVVERRVQKTEKNKVSSARVDVDNTSSDFIFKTIHKCDGR